MVCLPKNLINGYPEGDSSKSLELPSGNGPVFTIPLGTCNVEWNKMPLRPE